MAGKAVAAVKGMLERVGIKAPWKASPTVLTVLQARRSLPSLS